MIWEQLLVFFFPILFGAFFQQLYNTVDAVVVGRFTGSLELAAVGGSTGTIINLLFGFFIGLSSGATVIIAQFYGAGDKEMVSRSVHTAIALSIAGGAILSAIGFIFARTALEWMQTPDTVIDLAETYIKIYFIGMIPNLYYNICAAILRAVGDSKRPLYILIFSCLVNIVLDLVFIIVFKLGAPGAAWATIISQGVSGVLCLIYIWKFVPELRMKKEDWYFRRGLAFKQIGVGIPMGLQYSITAIGTMMVQTALNLLGSTQVAAFTAANKIEQIVTQAYVAMGTTMATYCAQNIGAGKIKRIRQGFRSITIMGSIYSVVVAAIIMTVGKYMTYLFLSGDLTEIMHSVDIYLKCVGTFFIPLTVVNVYRNGIQGMGYGLLPMMAGVAELVGRGVVAMIAAGQKSYFGVCMASPAAWILASALLIVMYYYVIHQNEKRFAKYADEE
mgnify:CR=1 FL=1